MFYVVIQVRHALKRLIELPIDQECLIATDLLTTITPLEDDERNGKLVEHMIIKWKKLITNNNHVKTKRPPSSPHKDEIAKKKIKDKSNNNDVLQICNEQSSSSSTTANSYMPILSTPSNILNTKLDWSKLCESKSSNVLAKRKGMCVVGVNVLNVMIVVQTEPFNDEAFQRKTMKTVVFSGRRVRETTVPTLFELAMRFVQRHIDGWLCI
jgi:hypothetical protein